MIVWLASYPRSGNTFVRMLLNRGFALKTFSLHGNNDPEAFASAAVTSEVGHMATDMAPAELVRWAKADPGLHVIKTHEPPLTDDPAIYVLRDGRSAVVSYWHFLNDIVGQNVGLDDVIRGHVFAGKWADHYRDWQPTIRPDTLLLRYEDAVRSQTQPLEALSSFLRLPIKDRTTIEFATLQRQNAKFFRSGSNDRNEAELAPHVDLFQQENGDVMNYAGYGR